MSDRAFLESLARSYQSLAQIPFGKAECMNLQTIGRMGDKKDFKECGNCRALFIGKLFSGCCLKPKGEQNE